MIIWINGAFGSGKTTTAKKLHKLLKGSFIYDPEEAGVFIRKNSPEQFASEYADFQDIPLWREMNYKMLKSLAEGYDGAIVVPMTLVNPDYYNEIIGRLISDIVDVRHFILYLDKPTLIKRLKKRAWGFLSKEDFGITSIDRCINAFDNHITETKIFANSKSVDEIAQEILQGCGFNK